MLFFTVGVYIGCVVLTVLLFLGLYGWLSGDWGMWEYATSSPHVMLLADITIGCLVIYFLYLLIGGSMYRVGKPREKKSKQSKNIYHP